MSSFAEISKDLDSYGIEGCYVRTKDIIAFTGQNWELDDSLEPRPTAIFFYYPDEPKAEQWAMREWHMTTGIHGCACHKPAERWVFIADPGEVYVIGQGDDDDEKSITNKAHAYFMSLRCIAGGYAHAVGPGREVHRRTAANKWQRLTTDDLIKSLPKELDHAGFGDIDGFSDNDLYACGPRGDLWHFNGKRWTQQDCPTDANFEKIVCAADGQVYVTADRHEIWVGRNRKWKPIKVDLGEQFFQEIVSYGDLVIVSTDEALYEISTGTAKPLPMGQPPMSNFAHLAAGDGVMVVAGVDEAFIYDGSRWKKIFQL